MDNKDLVWDFQFFNKQQKARNFVLGFENKLCVYSPTVEQLYTNYNIFFPKDEEHKLVILPNPYAHHDTFQSIEESSVRETGLFIVPDKNAEEDDNTGTLNMLIPVKGQDSSKSRTVPLKVGLQLINRKYGEDKPFLPVLMKGDLRELDTKTPCLHLHRLQLGRLSRLSQLELGDIQRVIQQRLALLFVQP